MSSKTTRITGPTNGQKTFHIGVGESETFVILLGGDNTSHYEIRVDLRGEGAGAKILGIIVGSGEEKLSLNTLQKHSAPNTISDLLVKGVFFDKSGLDYRGLIEIEKGAQNANAFQREENLVLSGDVEIDTRPELEIEANEVRCTHAATVGRIDEEQLYYLKSRGLNKKQAEELIIKGFLREVTGMIGDKQVKREIETRITELLKRTYSN